MNCNFSITYKSPDTRDGQLYWITDDVSEITIGDYGFVEVVDKSGKRFILPSQMIGRIDYLF
jgi:hypothetical protein